MPYEYREVDWTWQHLAIEAGQDSLLVVQQARIAAFDLAGGNPRWAVRIGNGWSPSPAHWTLVAGRRIYVRVAAFGGRTGEVGCLDSKTGQKLWLCDCGGTAVSDPLWCRGRLCLCSRSRPAAGQSVSPLCLMEINPDNGELISRLPILEMALRDRLPGDCRRCAGPAIGSSRFWRRTERCLDRLAGPDRLAPPGNDAALRHRPQLCASVLPAGNPVAGDGSSLNSLDAVRSIALPRIPASGFGSGASSACKDRRSAERALYRRTARLHVAVGKTTGEVLWQRCGFPALLTTRPGPHVWRPDSCAAGGDRRQAPQIVFLWIDMTTGETLTPAACPWTKTADLFWTDDIMRRPAVVLRRLQRRQ